jgi:hypothetical protein
MTDEWPGAGALLATRYRLVALLETGGMAQIWHANDELLARPVAIKLPTGPQVAWREARMAAKLSHPGIAAVHDFREAVRTDGTVAPFVVMELLAGETVAARLVRGTFSWQEAARVGAAVADALAAAHKGGVVHRDIKPGNVMLTPNGVKILDFGISAAAGEPDDDDTGATFGTPAYVAPERLDGMPAEPATDVYGLGVLLFEMVTGQPPYPVETWEELDEARRHGPEVLPLTLPADFRAAVEHCMADDPADRPPADAVRFELTALWLADQPEPADQGAAAKPAPAEASADSPAAGSSAAGAPAAGTPAAGTPAAGTPAADVSAGATLSGPATGGAFSAVSGAAASADGPPAAARAAGGSLGAAFRAGAAPAASFAAGAGAAQRRAAAGAGSRRTESGLPLSVSGASGRGPRVAQVWSSDADAPAGYTAGRVAADTLPMADPQPRRRLAVALALLALLVTAGGLYVVINRPKENVDAGPPATPAAPATPLFSAKPSTGIPTTRTTTAPTSPSVSPSPTLTFEDAVSRLQTTVENAAESGKIRGDVATDLLNLIRPLLGSDAKDVDGPVSQLRQQISGRVREGSLSSAQAAILRARLTDLDRAAGM